METISEQLKKFEIKIQTLGDQELLLTLQKLLDREKRVGDAILLALKEIKVRRIYAAMGYSSPFEMLVKHFNLSESSTYTRLQALKLMEVIPEVQADIASGDLSLSNAALVQGFIQRSEKENDQPLTLAEKKEVVELVKKKSNREAKAELAKKDPEVALPPAKEKPLALNHTQLQITVDAETMETLNELKLLLSHTIPDGNLKGILKYMLNLTVQTLKKRKGHNSLKETNGEIGEDKKLINQMIPSPTSQCTDPVLSSFPDSELSQSFKKDEAMNSSFLQPSFQKEQSFKTSKEYPVNNTDSKTSQVSCAERASAALTDSDTDVKDKTKEISLSSQRRQGRSINQKSKTDAFITNPLKRTRFIPQSTKRKIFQRAGGCCEFVSQNGKRCNSKYQLEWDHIIPWSQGGGNDEKSLRVYCRTHNQYRTKETHGFWYNKR